MDLYLGALVNREEPHGRAIQQASRIVLGPRVDGAPHATHVFVAVRDERMPSWLRLDGDVPRATFEAWSGKSEHATRMWRVPHGGTADQFGRFWRLAEELPRYDWKEIAGEATRVVVKIARELLPFIPELGRTRDAVTRAMICTRLANKVLGDETETLFPEERVRNAEKEGWEEA